MNWLLYIYLVVNGQALQTSIAYLTTPLLNVALGVGMFTAQSPTFPWMAIVLATSFSVYGLLKRYVPLDAIAQAENDKDMRQWEPLNSMLLISSTLAFARYDDKRMWAYDVIENAMTRNLGYSFSEEYDESAEDNEDTNEVGGQPGPRLNYGPTYYAAFVHDPEGNNIEPCSSERCQLSNNGKDRSRHAQCSHGGICHIPRESNISAAVWKSGPFSAEYSWISRKAENVSVGTALC